MKLESFRQCWAFKKCQGFPGEDFTHHLWAYNCYVGYLLSSPVTNPMGLKYSRIPPHLHLYRYHPLIWFSAHASKLVFLWYIHAPLESILNIAARKIHVSITHSISRFCSKLQRNFSSHSAKMSKGFPDLHCWPSQTPTSSHPLHSDLFFHSAPCSVGLSLLRSLLFLLRPLLLLLQGVCTHCLSAGWFLLPCTCYYSLPPLLVVFALMSPFFLVPSLAILFNIIDLLPSTNTLFPHVIYLP